MTNLKTTYDYGTGVLEIDLDGEVTGLHLTGEQFDSVVKQLAEVCTADVMNYDLGYKVGYSDAEFETDDRYDEGYDDGYDDGHSDGYAEAEREDDEDDE